MKLRRSVVSLLLVLTLLASLLPAAEAVNPWQKQGMYYFTTADGEELMADAALFASACVSYEPGTPEPSEDAYADPAKALGVPDYVSTEESEGTYVSLSRSGTMVLEFSEEFYDQPGPDICVFEIGGSVDAVLVEVSADGDTWLRAGGISGSTQTVDLGAYSLPAGETYRYVRLTDGGNNSYSQPYPGADIDAVCVMPQASDAYHFKDRAGNSVVVSRDSFATRVVEFTPGSPFTNTASWQNPQETLGLPDYDDRADTGFLSLGGSGVLVLEFEQDIVDGEGNDVYIFEIGPSVEATEVEVSPDNRTWYDLGKAAGKTVGLDMNGKVPDGTAIRFVRMTDLRTDTGMPSPGADIDAVCGINSNSRILNMNIPKGKYGVFVMDEAGKPILGADVSWNDKKAKTDRNGCALFDVGTWAQPKITVSKSGYDTWTNENSNWKKSDDRYTTVVLYEAGTGACRLQSALYSNHDDMSKPTDLLTKTKKLSLKNTGNLIGDLDFGEFYLSCSAMEPNKAARYELRQGVKLIADTKNGSFGKLSVESFQSGGGCYIRVVGKDGTKRDTPINLEFTENEVVKEFSLNLDPGGISIAVPDTVPFVGGGSVDFNFPLDFKALPVFSVSENKFKLGLNVNLVGNDSTAESMEKNNETLKQVKNVITRLKNSTTSAEKGGALRSMKQYVKKSTGVKFFKSCDVDFMLYAEGDLGSKTVSGSLVLVLDAKIADFEFDTMAIVVPVTVQVGFSVEGELMATVSLDLASATWSGGLDLNVTPKLKAFGGFGISKAVGIGAYGNADLAFKSRILGAPKGIRAIDLTGELGLKAYLAFLEYHRAFAHQTWHLYTANTVNAALSADGEAWNAGLYDASQYEKSDLSYLQAESAWLGGGNRTPMLKARAATAGGAKTELQTLLQNTYRNAQPVMVSAGDRLVGAFVRADAEGGARYLALTRFDGAAWTEPVRVDETAILDSAPSLLCDGDQIWLAYARTTEDPADSLLHFAQHQEIVVGTVDPETLAFTEYAAYPGEGYACMPTLALANGAPTLAWLDADVTDDDSVLAPPSGVIRTAAFRSGAWSAAQSAASVSGNVTQVVLGDTGAAYVANDTLFAASGAVLGNDVKGKVRWSAAQDAFVWNGENVLCTSAGEEIPAAGIKGEYALVGSDVYYSAATDTGANLAVVKYVDGVWSAPILLTGGDRYLENLSAAVLDGTVYALGLNTATAISEDAVEDAKDLVWTRVQPVNDLVIQAIEYDEIGSQPGDEVPVTVTVYNAGDHTAQSVELWQDDALVTTDTGGILPGQSVDLTLTQTCPEALTEYALEVSESGEEDFTAENNRVSYGLGYADVALTLSAMRIGSTRFMQATLVNEGVDATSGTVTFYDDAGVAIGIAAYPELSAGDSAVVACELPDSYADWEGTVTAVAESHQTERNLANNTASCDTALPVFVQILQQPQDASGALGEKVTFTVSAAGEGLTYQWELSKDGGKTWTKSSSTSETAVCTLASASRNGWLYRCIITDANGHSVTSESAKVIVKPSLAITAQPKDASGKIGDVLKFTVAAEGEGLTYQWQYSKDSGKTWLASSSRTTTATCTLKDATRNGWLYRCIVKDASGASVTSNTAKVIVLTGPVITSQPKNASGKVGDVLKFTIAAKGEGLTYQWQYSKDGGKIWLASSSRTTTATCTLSSAARNGWLYRCIVKDASGATVTSNTAKVIVLTGPVITSQPKNASGRVGEKVTFTVAATGEGLTYQWQLSKDNGKTWTASSSRTATATCTLTSASRNGWLYRCIVTDASGAAVTSNTAKVIVLTGPVITTQPKDASGKVGDVLKFTIAAAGDNLTYQWQYSKDSGKTWLTSSSKTTTATCTLSSASRNGWLYRCIVTDASGASVISGTAKVIVVS